MYVFSNSYFININIIHKILKGVQYDYIKILLILINIL